VVEFPASFAGDNDKLCLLGFHFFKLFLELYEENVVTSFKSNLLLMIFWFYIINYNS